MIFELVVNSRRHLSDDLFFQFFSKGLIRYDSHFLSEKKTVVKKRQKTTYNTIYCCSSRNMESMVFEDDFPLWRYPSVVSESKGTDERL